MPGLRAPAALPRVPAGAWTPGPGTAPRAGVQVRKRLLSPVATPDKRMSKAVK